MQVRSWKVSHHKHKVFMRRPYRLFMWSPLETAFFRPSPVVCNPSNTAAEGTDGLTIILKGQAGDEVHIRKVQTTTDMTALLMTYARVKGLEHKRVRLIFNGKRVEPGRSPASLGIVNGDVVDTVLEQFGC